jgi:hypothetical protein
MDCVGGPFSLEQWPCSTLLTTMQKVAIRGPRQIRMVEGHTQIEQGKRVGQVSPYRVYIDLNHCDSGI